MTVTFEAEREAVGGGTEVTIACENIPPGIRPENRPQPAGYRLRN